MTLQHSRHSDIGFDARYPCADLREGQRRFACAGAYFESPGTVAQRGEVQDLLDQLPGIAGPSGIVLLGVVPEDVTA